MNENYRPRLSAELTLEQGKKFFDIMPHGWQKPLCQLLVNGILQLYDKGGTEAIAAVISGYIGIDSLVSQGLNKTREVTLKDIADKHPEVYMKYVSKEMAKDLHPDYICQCQHHEIQFKSNSNICQTCGLKLRTA